jgi:integrase
MSARQRQAKALGWEPIKKFIETAGEGVRADRERALLTVAYDTMPRRAEFAALDLEDLTFWPASHVVTRFLELPIMARFQI